jgi:catechol 2,3-dioxygenase-like lactoylglutathione lyase family enzyme
MPLDALFHVAIKARDVDATRRFYVEVLGMTVDERPEVGFPGIWLRAGRDDHSAMLHIYAGEAALEPHGEFATGSGAVDHVAIAAHGYNEFCASFRRYGLQWRENVIPGAGLWQLFVYDPSGVLLELAFSAAAERTETPKVEPDRQYRARERFFNAQDYEQFAS